MPAPYVEDEAAQIQAKLDRKLEPSEIKQRPGTNGVKLAYLEGWKAYSLANEVFGFNGWSSSIMDLKIDFIDSEGGRYSIGVSCTVRISLKDGTYHEDVGYGSSENQRSKATAIGKAKKEAVTDATKRALRCFGSRLGNCMYDKDFLADIARTAASHQRTVHRPPPPTLATTSNEDSMATTTYIRAHAQTKTTSIHAPILYKSAPPIVLHEEASLSSLIMPEDEYEDLIDDSVFLEAAHSSELLTPKRKSRATSHTFIEESIQQQQQQQQQQHRTASHKSPFKLPILPHLGGSHHDR